MKLNKKVVLLTAIALVASSAFAKKMQVLDWIFRAPSISNPAVVDPATIGDMLFDTSDSNFKGWNGSAWISLGGAGSGNLNIRSVITTDMATTSDDVLLLSSSSFTETLYTAVGNTGKVLKLVHVGTNLSQFYTLQTTGGQTIGGIAGGSYALYTNGESLTVVSDGADWVILEHKAKTPWISYTPTFSNLGTATNVSFFWMRDGSNMIIQGKFTAGTTGGSTASISLPSSSQNIDSTAIATIRPVGPAWCGNGRTASYAALATGGTTVLNVGREDASNGYYTAVVGTSWLNNSEVGGIGPVAIPISGWQP